MLEQQFAQQIRNGRRITVTDDILMQYFLSLRVTEQYPNRVQTAAPQAPANQEVLLGLFANVDI